MARILSLMLMVCLSGVAAAADLADDIPTRIVNYADLDLSRDAHVEILYQRIWKAAAIVCDARNRLPLETYPRRRQCLERAIDRAVTDVDSPPLTSLRRPLQFRTSVGAPRDRRSWKQ